MATAKLYQWVSTYIYKDETLETPKCKPVQFFIISYHYRISFDKEAISSMSIARHQCKHLSTTQNISENNSS